MPTAIRTVEEFYAHALLIEQEAADRYAEFAEYFAERSEPVATLCRKLAALEREHFEELAAACAALELPDIAPPDYRWLEGSSPEAGARELFYRVATPAQLLEIALQAEWRAREFFAWIAKSAPSNAVRELAAIMAAEETEHVRWVREALENCTGGADWDHLLAAGVGPGIVSPE